MQLPVLIAEVERVLSRAASADSRERLAAVLAFLEGSRHVHQYVRFIGD